MTVRSLILLLSAHEKSKSASSCPAQPSPPGPEPDHGKPVSVGTEEVQEIWAELKAQVPPDMKSIHGILPGPRASKTKTNANQVPTRH